MMMRSVLTCATALLALPATADHVIATSKSEGLEVVAKGANPDSWCADKMRLVLKPMSGASDPGREAVSRVLSKLGGLFSQKCPNAALVSIESVSAANVLLYSGTASKSGNWSFVGNKPPAPTPPAAATHHATVTDKVKPDVAPPERPAKPPVKESLAAPDTPAPVAVTPQPPETIKHPDNDTLSLLAFAASKGGKLDKHGAIDAKDAFYALYAYLASGQNWRELSRMLKDEFAVKDFLQAAKPQADIFLNAARTYQTTFRIWLGGYGEDTRSFPVLVGYGNRQLDSGAGFSVEESNLCFGSKWLDKMLLACRLGVNVSFSNAESAASLVADEASARRIATSLGGSREALVAITYQPTEIENGDIKAKILRMEFMDGKKNVFGVIDEEGLEQGRKLAAQRNAEQAKREFEKRYQAWEKQYAQEKARRLRQYESEFSDGAKLAASAGRLPVKLSYLHSLRATVRATGKESGGTVLLERDGDEVKWPFQVPIEGRSGDGWQVAALTYLPDGKVKVAQSQLCEDAFCADFLKPAKKASLLEKMAEDEVKAELPAPERGK